MTRIVLPCSGYSEHKVSKKADTFTFVTDAKCKLTGFKFNKNAGNFKKHGGGGAYDYDYDGLDIPRTGAEFSYSTPLKGSNGTGVIKN